MNPHRAGVVVAVVVSLAGCASPAPQGPPEGRGDPMPGPRGMIAEPDSSVCGQAMASFDGTDARSNGTCACGTPCSCGGQGTYGLDYQCVELVMRHFKTHWGLSWYGNATDLLNNAPKADVDVHYNGDGAHPPTPGDMIVWESKTSFGHVALVTAVKAGGVTIIQQNVCGVSGAAVTLPYDGKTVGSIWGWANPTGWAHAKANGAVVGPSPCGCYDGDHDAYYCGSAITAYAGKNGCVVPSVLKGHEGDLFSCHAGTWSVGTTCPAGCSIAAGEVADVCNAGAAGAAGSSGSSAGGSAGASAGATASGGATSGKGGSAGAKAGVGGAAGASSSGMGGAGASSGGPAVAGHAGAQASLGGAPSSEGVAGTSAAGTTGAPLEEVEAVPAEGQSGGCSTSGRAGGAGAWSAALIALAACVRRRRQAFWRARRI